MSDCCTPGTGFPNSALMQQMALNQPVVWEEICMIQQAILSSASQCQPGGGQMCTTVGGNTPMTFITGLNSVTVVNGGSEYFVDNPAVYFRPPNGVVPTQIATASLVTNGSNIISIEVTEQGAGYQPVPATMSVSSLAGAGALLDPLVNAAGEIVGVNIVNGGTGYTLQDTVIATRAVSPNPAYTDAIFEITSVSVSGQIIGVAVLFSGTGYQNSVTEPIIVSSLDNSMLYPLGAGFFGSVITTNSGNITEVIVDNRGAGYSTYNPYLVINDPGTGAETEVILNGTSVASISVTESGTGYTQNAVGTVYNPSTALLPNPPESPAVVILNVANNTYGTVPNLYYQVWAGTATNKQIELQLNQVISYFKGLGYTIKIESNPVTGSTIQWKICW